MLFFQNVGLVIYFFIVAVLCILNPILSFFEQYYLYLSFENFVCINKALSNSF